MLFLSSSRISLSFDQNWWTLPLKGHPEGVIDVGGRADVEEEIPFKGTGHFLKLCLLVVYMELIISKNAFL